MAEDKNVGDMSAGFLELIENSLHGVLQGELARLINCAPSNEAIEKMSEKSPEKYFMSVGKIAKPIADMEAGGITRNNLTVNRNNLTVNINNFEKLGTNEKQKALGDMFAELKAEGEKMGYGGKLVEADVIPDDKGTNRIKSNG